MNLAQLPIKLNIYSLPLFYLRDSNFCALTCVAKNASVEINLNGEKSVGARQEKELVLKSTCSSQNMGDWVRVLKRKQKKQFLRYDVIPFESSTDLKKSLYFIVYHISSSYVMYTNHLPALSQC